MVIDTLVAQRPYDEYQTDFSFGLAVSKVHGTKPCNTGDVVGVVRRYSCVDSNHDIP